MSESPFKPLSKSASKSFRGQWLARWGLPGWMFLLSFIYPIPHTIALRNLLLGLGLSASLWLIAQNRPINEEWVALRRFRVVGWILVVLTLWLTVQSTFISPYPEAALRMLRGDWLVVLSVAGVGLCAVLALRRDYGHRLLTAIVLALCAHILWLLGYQIVVWLQTGVYPLGFTPFAHKDYQSMLVTTLVALLLASLVARAATRRAFFGLSWRLTALMLLLACVAAGTLQSRNAIIIVVALLVFALVLYAKCERKRSARRTITIATVLLLFGALVVWFGVRSDDRWKEFGEAAAVAFDTTHNLGWLDESKMPRPRMSNGQPVDHSAYMRIAWAKVGLEQVLVYPWGLGYGHKAFGWAVNRSYNAQTGHESSHSGLLDFTLANGIPGIVLWLALSAVLPVLGWRAFRQRASPAGLMLLFTVLAYLLRCLLDGQLSGFRLETYALIAAALVMSTALECLADEQGRECA